MRESRHLRMSRITSLANIDTRLVEGLRAIRSGQWTYTHGNRMTSNVLTLLSQDLGYPASWGDANRLPAYGGTTADIAWRSLGVHGRNGVGGLPCEIIHGTMAGRSCTKNMALRGLYAFLEALAIYMPVCVNVGW